MKNSNTSTLKPNSEKYRLYKEEFKKGNPLANPLVWKFRDIMMKVLEKNVCIWLRIETRKAR